MARHPRTRSREQLQFRKNKAVRFTRDVVGDPDRDEYAERRRVQLMNAGRGNRMAQKSIEDYRTQVADLRQQIRDLEDENQTLTDKLENIADVLEPDGQDDDEGRDDDEDTDQN